MRLVVLGTGTNVGKTFVTRTIATALRRELKVLALKPVESGVAPGEPGDAGAIAQAAGHPLVASPWRFTAGVSPHLAAREVGVSLASAELAAWVTAEQARYHPDVVLIETAGGAFSPLARGVTNVDLALALEPALWLLVAPDAVGVLHDVTTTLRALPRAPDALVLSSARPPDASTGRNAAELASLGIAEVLQVLGPGASSAPTLTRWIAAQRARHLSPVT